MEDYNWRRYWYRRGEEPPIKNSFLDISEDDYEINKKGLFTLNLLRDRGCLVLLGDAGLGKTTVMTKEFEDIEKSLEKKHILKVDLRSASSDKRIDKLIFQNHIFVNWKNGDYDLYLFLDSLDEGLLQVGTLGEILIEELSEVDISRLKLRIMCRTGVFSSTFENELRELWKEEFDVFQLAPLSLENIKVACEYMKYNFNEFMNAIRENNIEALSSIPVTLNMIIKMYDSIHKRLPSSKIELYEHGCRLLCSEVNLGRSEKKETCGNLSIDKRIEISMILAAITMFCNKNVIVKREVYDIGEISIDEFLRITYKRFKYNIDDIKEVLGSALFTEKAQDVFSWTHLSYAEFLAAKFLKESKFTKDQIISLIFQHEDNNNRLIPQLHYTASWIAVFSEEMFLEIVEKDPDVLCLSDLSVIDNKGKEKLLESLLYKYNLCKPYHRYGDLINYKKLFYNGIEFKLIEFIKSDTNTDYAKSIAIEIANVCNINTIAGEIWDLFIDGRYLFNINRLYYMALNTFFKLANENQKDNCSKLNKEFLTSESVLYFIKNLYPNYWNIYDIIEIVDKSSLEYNTIVSILEYINKNDLLTIIKEFNNKDINYIMKNSRIIDNLLIFCWNYVTDKKIEKLWNEMFIKRLKISSSLYHKSVNYEDFITDFKLNFKIRFNIIKLIWENNEEVKVNNIISFNLVLIDTHDLSNLLNKAYEENNEKFMKWTISLILDIYKFIKLDKNNELDENSELIYEKLKIAQNNIKYISKLKDDIKKYTLKYNNQKKKKIDYLSRYDISKGELRKIIETANEDVIKGWPMLIEKMRSKWYFIGHCFEYSLTNSEGWKLLDKEQKESVIKIAKIFLNKFNIEDFDKKDITSPIVDAIQLIWETSKNYIELWNKKEWIKFLDYVISPNASSYKDADEYFRIAYLYFPEQISSMLMEEMRQARRSGSWYGSRQIVEDRIISCKDEYLFNKIIETLNSYKITTTSKGDLLKLLIEVDKYKGIAYLNKLIDERYNTLSSCKIAIKAVHSLMERASYGGENKIIEIIISEDEKDKHFFNIILNLYLKDRCCLDFIDTWSIDGLVKLYEFVHNSNDKKLEKGRWKNILLQDYRYKKNKDFMKYILTLNKKIPDCSYIRDLWENMREKYFREIWNPPSSSMIVEMINNSELIPVSNGHQLLEILVKELYKFEKEINYSENPIAELLWNRTKNIIIPKDENNLSNFLKYYLNKNLKYRNIIANREVELFHNQGGCNGERVDIKVNAPCSENELNIYIEVKGCWNKELESSMEEQLVKRYMINRSCNYGIYVIGWFKCKQWTLGEDARRPPKYNLEEARKKFNEDAVLLSQKYGIEVRAVVLDLSLK